MVAIVKRVLHLLVRFCSVHVVELHNSALISDLDFFVLRWKDTEGRPWTKLSFIVQL